MLEFEINKILKIFETEKYNKEEKLLFLKAKKQAALGNEMIIKACDMVIKSIEEENNK